MLNQHSDVVNRECWLRPTGARRPIALDYVDQVEVGHVARGVDRFGIGVGDARLVALVAVVGHRSPVYCHSLAPRAGFSTGPYPREVVILTG